MSNGKIIRRGTAKTRRDAGHKMTCGHRRTSPCPHLTALPSPPPCPGCGLPQIVVQCVGCGEIGTQCPHAELAPGVRQISPPADDFADLIRPAG